jgi:MerR family transcriptional regulator/heat shock protein HspR
MEHDEAKSRRPHPAHIPRYVISVVSRLVEVPAHTLRTYDRLGLLSPARTGGGTRLYSDADVQRIKRIVELTRQGVNLTGVKVILEMETTHSEQRDEHGTVTRRRALIKLRTDIIPRE